MKMRIINPSQCDNPMPFAYRHVVKLQNFKRVLHLAQQGGENIKGKLSSCFKVQTKQTIQYILSTYDAEIKNIAMLRILVVNHIPQQYWLDAHILVPQLALKDMQIEIEATADTP